MVLGIDGDGSGFGDGDGDGSGSGFGDGDGSGSGSGSGFGDGDGETVLAGYLAHPRVTGLTGAGLDVTIGWWRSTKTGRSANGGRMTEAARPGLDQTVPGPLRLCTAGALHATAKPLDWEGDRWWAVALVGPVESDSDGGKAGALRRVIIEEAAC